LLRPRSTNLPRCAKRIATGSTTKGQPTDWEPSRLRRPEQTVAARGKRLRAHAGLDRVPASSCIDFFRRQSSSLTVSLRKALERRIALSSASRAARGCFERRSYICRASLRARAGTKLHSSSRNWASSANIFEAKPETITLSKRTETRHLTYIQQEDQLVRPQRQDVSNGAKGSVATLPGAPSTTSADVTADRTAQQHHGNPAATTSIPDRPRRRNAPTTSRPAARERACPTSTLAQRLGPKIRCAVHATTSTGRPASSLQSKIPCHGWRRCAGDTAATTHLPRADVGHIYTRGGHIRRRSGHTWLGRDR
jgi:hypothetical protein